MTVPQVDVVIACHSTARPAGRAVASVLGGTQAPVRVTVVAHNVTAMDVRAVIPRDLRDRVRYLELADGIHSPAGPFALGVQEASAPWVSIMGSDDWLQPGAMDAWLLRSVGADTVIPRLIHDTSNPVHTPPVRPGRHKWRDAVKDRLFYRSAPLGLMRTEFLTKEHLSFIPGLPVGEDLELSVALYGKGRVRVQRSGPAYVIGSSAKDRVTMSLAPLERELRYVGAVWDGVAKSLSDAARLALGTKFLRVHIFGAAYYRAQAKRWLEGDRGEIAQACRLILSRAPGCETPLSRADRDLLDALLDADVADAKVNQLALSRRKFGQPSTLLPRELDQILNREAPLRFMLASALVR